jgi:hypothetical protein
MGIFAIERMPRDVFPDLGVPVLYVAQPYGGMDPAQMEGFIVNYYEYHFLYITGIEHVESKSIQGAALIKLQFHPDTNMAAAMAETVSYVNRARAFMPTGTVPPFVMRFDAGNVPVGDLVFSEESGKLGIKDLQDAALFRVRATLRLPGAHLPRSSTLCFQLVLRSSPYLLYLTILATSSIIGFNRLQPFFAFRLTCDTISNSGHCSATRFRNFNLAFLTMG